MERSQWIAVFHLLYYLVGNEDALVELFASVDHAVTYGVNLAERLDAAFLGVCEDIEDCLYGLTVVNVSQFLDFFGTVGAFEFQEAVGQTDFFHSTFCEGLLGVGVYEFVFYGAASAVQYKYFHLLFRL